VDVTPDDLLILREKAKIIFSLVCILWGIHALNWAAFQGKLNTVLGIRPRDPLGLFGVAAAHFLHVNQSHLIANTWVLLALGGFVILQGVDLFNWVTLVTALITGLGTWLFGIAGIAYVGASGVLFGYLGFLLVYGVIAGNFLALLLAAVTGMWYGNRLVGILPGGMGGWIGHLFGFAGGVLAAYWLTYGQTSPPP
jgi:membrane associated rhomboid family serine protease